jgi:hypothetical protein
MKPTPFQLSARLFLAICLVVSTSHYFSAPATASELPDPILNRGLWEVVTTESMRKGFESTERRCVGPKAQEVKLMRGEAGAKLRTCKLSDVQSAKDIVSYTAMCTTDYGVTGTSQIAFKGNFAREFVRTEIVKVEVLMPMYIMTRTQRFKYKGACPQDLAPGETVLEIRDGSKMPKWNRYNPPQPNKNPSGAQK